MPVWEARVLFPYSFLNQFFEDVNIFVEILEKLGFVHKLKLFCYIVTI